MYSLKDARQHQWASFTKEELSAIRVGHLDRFVEGRSVLEAGCGGGAFVDYLARKGFDVTGADITGEFIEWARENREGNFVTASITDLPFPDKSFDTAYSFDVLEHVEDYAALKELARVTRRRIIFTVPLVDDVIRKYGLTFPSFTDPTHLRYYTKQTAGQLCESVSTDYLIEYEGVIATEELVKWLVLEPTFAPTDLLRFRPNRLLGKLLTSLLSRLVSPATVRAVALRNVRPLSPEVVCVVRLA